MLWARREVRDLYTITLASCDCLYGSRLPYDRGFVAGSMGSLRLLCRTCKARMKIGLKMGDMPHSSGFSLVKRTNRQ